MIVVGGFLVGFGTRYCRWLYFRSCDYGFAHLAITIVNRYLLFYGRWILNGEFNSSLYIEILKTDNNDKRYKTRRKIT